MNEQITLCDRVMPYFMKNKDWFYENDNGYLCLTDVAPPEALKSYEEFYKEFYTEPKVNAQGRLILE